MAGFLDILKQGLNTALEMSKNGVFAVAKAINRNRGKVYAGTTAALLVADCIAVPPSIMQIPGKIAISAVTSVAPAGLFYLASYITERKMTVQQVQAPAPEPAPAPEQRHVLQESVQSVNVGAAKTAGRRKNTVTN